MKTYYLKQLDNAQQQELCQRQGIQFDAVLPAVKAVVEQVKANGDKALREFTQTFDKVTLDAFTVSAQEIEDACARISPKVQAAFKQAAANIEKFHASAPTGRRIVETMPGVRCFAEMRAIEKVGLYIPGGTAPLPSTVLMLAIPAILAGCREIVLATPPSSDGRIADIILFAAKLCGVNTMYKLGGAQAIAALAYGTQTVPKVSKIFGPGNQYVTAAKLLVSVDPDGAAIDMPAGPTEVLVIADERARADFVAADLLSQAEHGADSQVVLVCINEHKTSEILREVKLQLRTLPRKAIAARALENSFALVVESVAEAMAFSNKFAPEHLILNLTDADDWVEKVTNAGSVFVGPYACESAGDYASGTNHSLPTYGYARAYSGVSVASFQKQITFQIVTAAGAKAIAPTVTAMAGEEGLVGHKRAMELRS